MKKNKQKQRIRPREKQSSPNPENLSTEKKKTIFTIEQPLNLNVIQIEGNLPRDCEK